MRAPHDVPDSAALTDDALHRLRLIEGQVRGLQRMMERGADCLDLLTQIAAVRAALDAVGLSVVDEQVWKFVRISDDDTTRDNARHVLTAVERFLRR